ncbi:MAG TPA: pectate lyase [Opitutaceae bacterium]|nr:pectate lyase [Opitutaceae bacterium]
MAPRLIVALLAALASGSLSATVPWKELTRQPAEWYASAEARAIATSVRQYQTESGGWPKNRDMTAPPDAAFLAETEFDHRAPTIDNGATYTQIRFLAAVASHGGPDLGLNRAAAVRGLEYLLKAQYANGGWPQYYPLRPGYYTHITFNDDAMVNVLRLLRDVANRKEPFGWLEPALRARAATAVDKGIACILRCQIVVAGRKTVWCAQHDEITFEPAPARAYEHVSLSGAESVGIVGFLMGVKNPSPEIVDAVESAIAWFEAAKLTGIRLDAPPAPDLPHGHDRVVVEDPGAPPLWARFYEIGTNRPIFGGRDTVVRYNLAEVERERRGGYRWYLDDPAELLSRDYPRWKAKLAQQAAKAAKP